MADKSCENCVNGEVTPDRNCTWCNLLAKLFEDNFWCCYFEPKPAEVEKNCLNCEHKEDKNNDNDEECSLYPWCKNLSHWELRKPATSEVELTVKEMLGYCEQQQHCRYCIWGVEDEYCPSLSGSFHCRYGLDYIDIDAITKVVRAINDRGKK